jgi:hypothetical protein
MITPMAARLTLIPMPVIAAPAEGSAVITHTPLPSVQEVNAGLGDVNLDSRTATRSTPMAVKQVAPAPHAVGLPTRAMGVA